MKFVDEAKILARSGAGGNGAVSFLREKYRPHGGPDGGDGGKGGDVVFVADRNLATLLDFKFTPIQVAEPGGPGRGKKQSGKDGEDRVIRVPVGTVVHDDETGETLHDLARDGERWIALEGGRGGRGNARFATPTRQAPRKAESGRPGRERTFRLELKLLADVGLVGFPNAGKSTLLSRVSAARPKIADYPFTTLAPQLGVVTRGRRGEERTFVIADIPGLIEGASEGAGLGFRFLRHVERTSVFLHVVDAADESGGGPAGRFKTVEREILRYDPELGKVPVIVAANKIDLAQGRSGAKLLAKKLARRGIPVLPISGVTGEGIEALLRAVEERVRERRAGRVVEAP